MIKLLTCLLVISITIVHGADNTTTFTIPAVPGGTFNDDNSNKTVEIESVTNTITKDQFYDLFSEAIRKSTDTSDDGNDDGNSTSNPMESLDEVPSGSTPSTSPTYIQTVPKKKSSTAPVPTVVMTPAPRKRLSTLPPISTMASLAALNNSHMYQGWIADEISDALWAFAPQPSTNPKCTLDSQMYRNNIHNFTLWAMQMLDSSNRIPSGLLSGSVYQLGHFDQCVRINLPDQDLDGKYCLPTIKFAPTKVIHPDYQHDTNIKFVEPEPHESAWEYFEPNNDLSRRPRDLVHWAVCVPASCTVEDVHEALNDALIEPLAKHGLRVNVSLSSNKCYARREDKPFSTGFFITVGIFLVLYVVVIFATWMDMFYYQSGRPHSKSLRKWLKPFSGYTNMTKLITPNTSREFVEFHYLKAFAMICVVSGHRQMSSHGPLPNENPWWMEWVRRWLKPFAGYTNVVKLTRANTDTQFAEFHFLKAFAITCVISGHRQMALHGPVPNENPWWMEWTYTQFLVAFSANGGVLVDTFFLLSGFLTCHYIYQELIKRKRLNLFAIIVNRWIRIAPVYMFVMAVYGWVLPYMGDGPLWKERIGLESTRCVKSWWLNLLFINNYINSEDQCMVQAWYLACDMHYFIVGSLIVYALWKWPKAGKVLMWLTLFVSCAIPGYITLKNRYWGVVLHYNSLFIDPVSTEQFRTIYMPSHNRFGPYMVGIISAYLLHKLKKSNFKFSVPVMIVGSIIGAGLSIAAIMVGYIFYIRDRPYSVVESVLYAATHRTIWAVGIVWFIIVDATTGYGILYNILKHPFFTPFGRLTYCAYLVHMLPQMIHLSTSRLPIYLDLKRMFWYTMGDFVMTYLLALVLNLLFEAPLERLQKKILKKLLATHDAKDKLRHERKFNGELSEVGVDNQAMEKTDIA